MSAYEMHASGGIEPGTPERPKRHGFAGERLGAWLFAASFSIGIWGLALKVLEPSHRPTPVGARHATLAPSGAPDGRAKVVWADDAYEFPTGYPTADGMPVIALTPPAHPTADQP